jgi:DNA-directed RNA polymerase subunit M/transcription elongation factor TFIIS
MSRGKSIELFKKIFTENTLTKKIDEQTLKKLAQFVELSCYTAAEHQAKENNIQIKNNLQFLEIYQIIINRVAANIDESSDIKNNTLIARIKNTVSMEENKKLFTSLFGEQTALRICKYIKTVNIKNIGFLTSEQLNPLSNAEENKIIKLRANQKIDIKTSKMYVCPRCLHNESKIYRQQTRAGDEGYTFIIECINCGFCKKNYS